MILKTPKIIESPFICKSVSWFMEVGAITIWPFIFCRDRLNTIMINHESIHIKQQQELFVIVFYILYLWYWFKNLCIFKNAEEAYKNICFEIEAYDNQANEYYLSTRKKFAWRTK